MKRCIYTSRYLLGLDYERIFIFMVRSDHDILYLQEHCAAEGTGISIGTKWEYITASALKSTAQDYSEILQARYSSKASMKVTVEL